MDKIFKSDEYSQEKNNLIEDYNSIAVDSNEKVRQIRDYKKKIEAYDNMEPKDEKTKCLEKYEKMNDLSTYFQLIYNHCINLFEAEDIKLKIARESKALTDEQIKEEKQKNGKHRIEFQKDAELIQYAIKLRRSWYEAKFSKYDEQEFEKTYLEKANNLVTATMGQKDKAKQFEELKKKKQEKQDNYKASREKLIENNKKYAERRDAYKSKFVKIFDEAINEKLIDAVIDPQQRLYNTKIKLSYFDNIWISDKAYAHVEEQVIKNKDKVSVGFNTIVKTYNFETGLIREESKGYYIDKHNNKKGIKTSKMLVVDRTSEKESYEISYFDDKKHVEKKNFTSKKHLNDYLDEEEISFVGGKPIEYDQMLFSENFILENLNELGLGLTAEDLKVVEDEFIR